MKKNVIQTGLKVAFIVACLLSNNKVTSQPNAELWAEKVMMPESQKVEKPRLPVRLGLGLETYVAGNAHGAFYAANINLSRGKSLVSLGAALHKRCLEMSGVKLGYSYLLSGINDRYDEDELNELKDDPRDILELRLLCYGQYTHQGKLSYKASRVETITNSESKVNFNEVRFSTVEGAVCLELDINVKWMKIRNYMGFTTFYHFNHLEGMYRSKCSVALTFGTGIIIPSL